MPEKMLKGRLYNGIRPGTRLMEINVKEDLGSVGQ